MRTATLAFLLALAAAAFGGRTSTTIHIDDDGTGWASFERDGVRYETHDRGVMREIDRVLAGNRDIAEENREIGRKHRDLGHEHARIGREHARLGREAARGDLPRSELERRQHELEQVQNELEERQHELERQQEKLEKRQRAMENVVNRDLEEIFAKAVREGKATRRD